MAALRDGEGLFFDLDLYAMEDLLTDDERALRDRARSFVEEKVAPVIARCEREGRFNAEWIPDLGALGLLGGHTLPANHPAPVPRPGPVAYGLAMAEIERADSCLRSFATVQGNLVVWPLLAFGSPEQQDEWLGPLATGEARGAFGLTEPGYGSDPGGMETTATPVNGGWRLDGSKRWITSGSIADVVLVFAKAPDGVGGFLVRKGAEGFTAEDVKGKFSFRASLSSALTFDSCFVPEADRLPKAKGLAAPLRCLNHARYSIAWGVLGAAQACFGQTLDYLKKRVQFGRPLAGFQLVQRKLAKMAIEITKAQLLAYRLGRIRETKARHDQISIAKRNNVDVALNVARTCRDLLGAEGITDRFCVGRHLTNLETVKTYEGTHDIHALVLGEKLTGLRAFE